VQGMHAPGAVLHEGRGPAKRDCPQDCSNTPLRFAPPNVAPPSLGPAFALRCRPRRRRPLCSRFPSRSPGSNLARLELDFPQSRPVHGRELFRVRCLLPSTWLKKRKNWGDKKRTGDKGRGKGTQSTPHPLAILPTISLACMSSFLRSSFFFTGAYATCDTLPRLHAYYLTPSHDFGLTTTAVASPLPDLKSGNT
jgi:hypothetical protein